MARVKACRLCGRRNAPDELFCEACGTSLADVPAMDERAIERLAAEGADGGADEARTADAVGRPEPGGGADAAGQAEAGGADEARPADALGQPEGDGAAVRDRSAPDCALLFPWGRVPVAGELSIGRETGFSPLSRQLDVYPTVSRQHAVVRRSEARWTVQDLSSTNGTWVNGSRLAAGEARPIGNGDRVGFSQTLEAEIRIGPASDGR